MVNVEKIKKSVILFLEAIGENPQREGLIETPMRVAKMCEELFNLKYETDSMFKKFNSNFDDIVLVKNINFCSICEHHILPFFGTVNVAYVPNKKIIGLSKIARIINYFSKRLQIQENLTNEIATSIFEKLNPQGVMVLIQAQHTCMTIRGVKQTNSLTSTISKKGIFKTNENLQTQFFKMMFKN